MNKEELLQETKELLQDALKRIQKLKTVVKKEELKKLLKWDGEIKGLLNRADNVSMSLSKQAKNISNYGGKIKTHTGFKAGVNKFISGGKRIFGEVENVFEKAPIVKNETVSVDGLFSGEKQDNVKNSSKKEMPKKSVVRNVLNSFKRVNIVRKQNKLYEEFEEKGIGKRSVKYAPKTIIPDEDGKYGAALKFKSTKDMHRYGREFEKIKNKTEYNIDLIKNMGSADISKDEYSRMRTSWLLNRISAQDLEGCYYLLRGKYLFSLDLRYYDGVLKEGEVNEKLKDVFRRKHILLSDDAIISKSGDDWIINDEDREYKIKKENNNLNIYDLTKLKKIKTELKNVEKKRGISLFPICIVVPDKIWSTLSIKLRTPSFSKGVCITTGIRFSKVFGVTITFVTESIVISASVHELVHVFFESINTIEGMSNNCDRYFIEETTAYFIDGSLAKEIEAKLIDKYIDGYIKLRICNEDEREKYEDLISNKLIPVADYLNRKYPQQFFDIMIRSSSIDELWERFGNKIDKKETENSSGKVVSSGGKRDKKIGSSRFRGLTNFSNAEKAELHLTGKEKISTHIKKDDIEIGKNSVRFFINLYDDKNNPLAGKEINYDMNGKMIKITDTTDENGLAVVLFRTKEEVKEYEIKVIFVGDEAYNRCIHKETINLAEELKNKKHPPTDKRTRVYKQNEEKRKSSLEKAFNIRRNKRNEIMANLKKIEAEVKEISEEQNQ